jgi:tripartite-type tricarboxylate transporter receptor subunit TctC
MSGDAAIVVAPSLFKSLPYDPTKDLAPIIQVTRTPNILVVNPESGPKSLAELVEAAKAKPGMISFNSSGYGTSQHMGIKQLQAMAGIKVLHVPKNGPTAPEIMAGQVTASFMNITLALPLVQAGNLRALGLSGSKRSASAPEIPTVAEQGYAGFDAVAWFGLLAPAGTPEAVRAPHPRRRGQGAGGSAEEAHPARCRDRRGQHARDIRRADPQRNPADR